MRMTMGALIDGREFLTLAETTKAFGITSTATIRNWLLGKHFEGRIETPDGPMFEVSRVREILADIEQTRAANESGHLEIPDFGDEDPYARPKG
jgi:hypothetical protein